MSYRKVFETNNLKMSLYITIKCNGKKSFRAFAEDYRKNNSKYADRNIEVDGERTIFFSFPIMPKQLMLVIFNSRNPNDKDFTVEIQEGELKTYNIWLDQETRDFLSLAMPFCQVCGFTNASPTGTLFQTQDKHFTIKYLPVIKSGGMIINTPSRIGHQSGIIEVSKAKYDTYTVAMRAMITLHEYSHKYRNPKIDLEISNEIGADINALYIYLGLGFSKIDAICVYANVFLKAQTRSNVERMRKINDYIRRFENNEYAKINA